jgi:hypothetical protein
MHVALIRLLEQPRDLRLGQMLGQPPRNPWSSEQRGWVAVHLPCVAQEPVQALQERHPAAARRGLEPLRRLGDSLVQVLGRELPGVVREVNGQREAGEHSGIRLVLSMVLSDHMRTSTSQCGQRRMRGWSVRVLAMVRGIRRRAGTPRPPRRRHRSRTSARAHRLARPPIQNRSNPRTRSPGRGLSRWPRQTWTERNECLEILRAAQGPRRRQPLIPRREPCTRGPD